jgi:hypothetical protein
MDIKWPAYPFGQLVDKSDFAYSVIEGGERVPGVFSIGISRKPRTTPTRTHYYPTANEIAVLGESPNWDRLRAKLLAQGHSIEAIREMTPIDVSALVGTNEAKATSKPKGKRGGKSTEQQDIGLWDEYSKGLNDGHWFTKAAFADAKKMKRPTVSKALKRGEAAKRELNRKPAKRSRSR